MRLLLYFTLAGFAPAGNGVALVPPKAAICLAPATVEASPSSATNAADAVREAFGTLLTSPTLVVKSLSSKVPSAARDEARSASCGFILFSTMRHVRTNGARGRFTAKLLGGALRAGASTASSEVGAGVTNAVGGATGRVLGSAANAATTTASNAAAAKLYARSVRIRDEMTLHTRLERIDGTTLVDRTDKRKAAADQEDLVSVLAQQAAAEVAARVSR